MIALDESSILHTFKFKVPPVFQQILGQEIKHRNCDKLNNYLDKIFEDGEKPYRFTPGLSGNVFKVVNELVGGSNSFMSHALKLEVKKGLQKFREGLDNWGEIPRNDNCDDILEMFRQNERQLKKNPNIPEIEDCSIIAGYHDFQGDNKKLVSEDEHFWGYKDLISDTWHIQVKEEWSV